MKNKIAIILPDLGGGGAERLHIDLAKAFISMGYIVEFLLFEKKGELLPVVPKQINIVDLKVTKLHRGLCPLIRFFKKTRPDAVLAAMWPLTVIVLLAKFISRIKSTVVVSEHTTLSYDPIFKRQFNRLILPFTMRILYPLADTVIGVSDGVVADLKQLSKSKKSNFATVYNPACPDITITRSLKPDFTFWERESTKRIIAVGSLNKPKDYPTLIRAFRIVRMKVDAELLILGEGEERMQIEALIDEYNLQKDVHMPGFVTNPIPYTKSADLFVLSSAWEGFGNVIVEALACGIPVVSTNCKSGPAEILEDGKFGILVPVGDAEVLANAIMESLEKKHDPAPLIGRAQHFAVEKIAKQYLRLLFPKSSVSSED